MNPRRRQRGSLLITAVALIVVMGFLAAATTYLMTGSLRANLDYPEEIQSFYIAESGLARGTREWRLDPAYAGETNTPFASGFFTVTVADTDFAGAPLPAGQKRISSTALIPRTGTPPYQRTTEAIVQQSSGDAGWVVGLRGRVWQWDGTQWNNATTPTNRDLNDVHCTPAGDCWAVGNNGTILHWNGVSWSAFASGTGNDLMDVACDPADPTHCFAVGLNGTVLSWNGITWSTVAVPAGGRDLMAVTCPTSDCYVVGANSTILRYDAATPAWINESFSNRQLLDVSCTASTDCWAVGARSGNRFTLFRRTSSGWQDASVTSPQRDDLNTVSCASASHCFAAGAGGVMLEYNGVAWGLVNSGVNANLNGLWCSQSIDECWAVGDRVRGGGRGGRGGRGGGRGSQATVQRWQGTTWASETTGMNRRTTDLLGVAFAGAGAGRAVLAWRDVPN